MNTTPTHSRHADVRILGIPDRLLRDDELTDRELAVRDLDDEYANDRMNGDY